MSEIIYTNGQAAIIAEPESPPIDPRRTARRPTHALFVDENGHSALRNLGHPDNHYLALTGVACSLAHASGGIASQMDDIKLEHFGTTNIVLHCEDIKHRKGVFGTLSDGARRVPFDRALLAAFEQWDYTVFSVLLDKRALVRRYGETQHEPYHYAMEVLVDGYVRWLEAHDALGIVHSEARAQGGKEDRKLKQAYRGLWTAGTDFLSADRIQARLTSREIKISGKQAMVPGLQLADLLAHPSFVSMRARAKGEALQARFGSLVVQILEASRYYRVDGEIDGSGRKWLP